MLGLKLKRVVYTETKNLGNFENCRVEAEAEIDPEDDINSVMKRLRVWVRTQIAEAAEDDFGR